MNEDFRPTVRPGLRPDRVAESFKEVLATEIVRLKDPRIGFVTLTAVDVTPDLRRARVYYTVLGEEADHRGTAAGLRSARPRLRTALGKKIRLKFLPEIDFVEDQAQVRGDRIETLLRDLHTSDD
jgi:ribosome-binding factor A